MTTAKSCGGSGGDSFKMGLATNLESFIAGSALGGVRFAGMLRSTTGNLGPKPSHELPAMAQLWFPETFLVVHEAFSKP
jgi:hypothetical protein